MTNAMPTPQSLRRSRIIGWILLLLCLALALACAALHFWSAVVPLAIGVIVSAGTLWYNGSMDGMQFMRDLWKLP